MRAYDDFYGKIKAVAIMTEGNKRFFKDLVKVIKCDLRKAVVRSESNLRIS